MAKKKKTSQFKVWWVVIILKQIVFWNFRSELFSDVAMCKYNFYWFFHWKKAKETCFLINFKHDKKRFLMILSFSFNNSINKAFL